MTKLAVECVGNGAVADVDLEGTKGHHSGWLTIAMGYGFGVMFPVLMFGGVSGAHINPAMTLGQAVIGIFPWSQVLPYILAQLVGAALGQLVVYVCYFPHYRMTKEPAPILGTFCTTDASGSLVNYFINEFFGTLAGAGSGSPLLFAGPMGVSGVGCRLHRRRLDRLGAGHLSGRSHGPWSEPRTRPGAALPALDSARTQ